MNTLCGLNCCTSCPRLADSGGCEACGGHPFGGECAAALVAHMPADSALYAALAYDEQNRDPMRGMDEGRLEAVARSLGVRR